MNPVKTMVSILLLILIVGVSSQTSAQQSLKLTGMTKVIEMEYAQEVVKALYKSVGISTSFELFPGKRSFKVVGSGEFDGIIALTEKAFPALPFLIPIKVSVGSADAVAVTYKKDIVLKNGWADVKKYTTTYPRGIKLLEQVLAGTDPIIADSYEQLFKIIQRGRAEIALCPGVQAQQEVKKHNIPGIKIIDPPIQSVPLYHCLHKKHESLVPKLTEALKKMEVAGEINKIWNEALAR